MKKIFAFVIPVLFSLAANADEKQDAILRGVGNLNVRITTIEEQNRRLQGRLEDLEYKIQQIEKRQTTSETTSHDATIRKENPYQQYVSPVEKTPSAPEEEPAEADEVTEDEKPAQGAAEYERAFIQLGKLQYDEAEKSFKSFVAKYPASPLAGDSYYWLGEIAYANDNYKDAAINYLKSYKANPKSDKAPEAILKTASSLKALGRKDEACKNYQRFMTEFPKSHATLRNSAQKEMKALACK